MRKELKYGLIAILLLVAGRMAIARPKKKEVDTYATIAASKETSAENYRLPSNDIIGVNQLLSASQENIPLTYSPSQVADQALVLDNGAYVGSWTGKLYKDTKHFGVAGLTFLQVRRQLTTYWVAETHVRI